jgi:hypothetical protein
METIAKIDWFRGPLGGHMNCEYDLNEVHFFLINVKQHHLIYDNPYLAITAMYQRFLIRIKI